jgi:hypothetical protein
VKIAGRNGDKNANTHHKETGANIEELKNLKVGEFHIKEGTRPSIKMKAPSDLIKNKNTMSSAQWNTKKEMLLTTFYRPLGQIVPDEYRLANTGLKEQDQEPKKNHAMNAITDKINTPFDIEL